MKIKFDVTPKELNIIQDIFAKHLCDGCSVWVFGSRAKNTALFNSDLDLVIECKDKVDLNRLNKIKSDLEFSRLPYTVDLIDINAIKPHFKDLIQSEMIAFPLNKNINIPKLRFKEFRGEWVEKRLGDVCSITTGNSNREDSTLDGEYTFFDRSEDIRTSNIYLFDSEAVIVAGEGQRFIPKYFIGKFDLHQRTYAIIDFIDTCGKFIYYKIYVSQNYFLSQAVGSTVKSLRLPMFKKMLINLPSLQEQTKIAAFLTSVDKKIELLTQKEKLLKDYKKGIMQKIFSQEIRFKADDGSEFPEWVEKRLGDVCSITTGNSNREDSTLDGEYTFFDRSEDIRTSNIYLFDSEAVIVAGEGQRFIPKYFIGKFDLHQRTYAIIDFIDTCGKFIYYKIYVSQNYFLSQAVGSTVKSLRLPMFKKMLINLPSLQEQTKIANFLSAIDSKIEQVAKQLDYTKEFKKGLLQQMFV